MDRTLPGPGVDTGTHGAPRVCVIVTGYGVADVLGEALGSLQAQTLTDWECIVTDDGAPDDVAGAVAPFLHDSRIRFLATANGGVSTARNRAIAQATAPLIAILDGDDLYRPEYLTRTVPVLETHSDVRLVTCNARIFGAVPEERLCVASKQGSSDGIRGSLADVLDRSFNVYIGTTFRRSDFDAIGGFDTTLSHSEDFDLWVRLMLLGGDAWYIDEVLGDYRVRPNSASSKTEKMIAGTIAVYEKARAALPEGRPEVELLDRLLDERRRGLEFERAISAIIGGDTRAGLAKLHLTKSDALNGLLWRTALALWGMFPGLAAPMLSWRRRRHARGYVSGRRAVLRRFQTMAET